MIDDCRLRLPHVGGAIYSCDSVIGAMYSGSVIPVLLAAMPAPMNATVPNVMPLRFVTDLILYGSAVARGMPGRTCGILQVDTCQVLLGSCWP